MILKHPLRKEDGEEYSTKDFFRRLANENTGNYLLGSNHFWHGGIHFSHGNAEVDKESDQDKDKDKEETESTPTEESSASSNKKIEIKPHYEPVYAIGEGKLIAYRLNKKYEQTTYENREDETWELNYSTSFCLIKHELKVIKEEVPEESTPTAGTSRAFATAKDELPWVRTIKVHRYLVKSEDTTSSIARDWTGHFGNVSVTDVTADIGMFNPEITGDLSNHIGKTILLPDYKAPDPPTPPDSPESGTAEASTEEEVATKLTFYSLYMHLAAYEDYEEKAQTITVKSGNINARSATDVNSVLGTLSKGAILEHKGEEQTVGSNHFVLGVITSGQVTNKKKVITAKAGDNVWVASKLVSFSSNSIARPPYWEKTGSALDDYLESPQADNDTELVNPYSTEERPTTEASSPELTNPHPKKFTLKYDSVHLCDIPVTADTLIGHLGRYDVLASYEQNKREVMSKNQLHYEIFTNASESEMKDFLDNKAKLFQDRKYIKLTKDSKIKTIPVPSTIPAGDYTLQHDHAIGIDASLLVVEDSNKNPYYRVILHDGNREVIGYHPKNDDANAPDIICQHDWRKLGFEIIEESNADSDGLMDIEKMPKFFKDLHKEIDQFGAKGREGYGDGVITAVELKLALGNTRLRDRWSKLIAKHPSEWRKDNASIIAALEALLIGTKRTLKTLRVKGKLKKNVELGQKVLTHEKERMKALSFWEDIPELGSPSVYHFHPIAFVENASQRRHPIIYIDGKPIELTFLYFYDGTKITDADYEEAAEELGCEVNAIKAVAMAETGITGSYYSHGKNDTVPAILYERHKFYNNFTGDKKTRDALVKDHPDLINASRYRKGRYGRFDKQYNKLMWAYEHDPVAALKAPSWGKFQILGENHKACGFGTVEEFVKYISISEKNHLKAFVSIIKSNSRLAKSIVSKEWTKFATAYNGAGQDGYDTIMEKNYNALKKK